ncbi:hypothetical protein A33Q_0173 [Indibacter alkaliphilus LW1]|uniref:Uncharacterized protein n=1 Tax=Indibacter alkaliphilus (strain CCUG 57479 / KCTC 22604 / LW1) TaxID=1189612 RepID=S2DLM6_INDAL|nr:hypothetical protein A33Q_0173 [Indibacter alkaliphilus LW1]
MIEKVQRPSEKLFFVWGFPTEMFPFVALQNIRSCKKPVIMGYWNSFWF